MTGRGPKLLAWLAATASAPLSSLALWQWLTSAPSSGCYGLSDGASLGTFAEAPLELVLDAGRDPSALLCAAAMLALPLAGLAVLLARPRVTPAAIALTALGHVALALGSLVLVSSGC